MRAPSPATMSVSFLHPVFNAQHRHGRPKSDFASQLGLSADALDDPQHSVPASSVYRLLAWSAAVTGDPYFLARVGQNMALGGWAPVLPLINASRTLGEFLQKFSHMAATQGRAVKYRMVVEGQIAQWRLIRPAGTSSDATYADAIAAVFFIQVLKSSAQEQWEPSAVVATLQDKSRVPPDLIPPVSTFSGDEGFYLSFPSEFLSCDMPVVLPPADLPEIDLSTTAPESLLDTVARVVKQRISDPRLGVATVEKAVGLAPWKLQSLLQSQGTDISEIRGRIRRDLALQRVGGTTDTIGSIATDLGYSTSSNFTRAFRAWTGKSPREDQRDH